MNRETPIPTGHPYSTNIGPTPNTDALVNGETPPLEPRVERESWPKIPGYEILGELGRGGMGVVYKALQLSLKRPVAIKMIKPGSDAGKEELARFHAEAEAVASLQHPNFVQIHEIGEYEDKPFLSLEFVDGGSLAQRVQQGPLPADEAARVVAVLARAIQAAHQRGIVHRDLKPANVLISADGTLKITDFGLAKQLRDSARRTLSGAVMGTPGYMAPEQALGRVEEVGPVTDVYGLGGVLYDLLTGRPPFQSDGVWSTLHQVVFDEPVPPSHLRPDVPPEMEAICLRCLQKEPQKRYASAQLLADDLDRFLNGESVLAGSSLDLGRLFPGARRVPVAGETARMKLADLREALRAVQPAAVLVAPRIIDRVIRQVWAVPVLRWRVPHRKTYVVDRHVLFRYVEQEELDLDPEQLLPPTVLLLERPSAETLNATGREELLLKYWRRLFHASVHFALEERLAEAKLTPADIRERIAVLGPAAFDEIRHVLDAEDMLPPTADERVVYLEFVACYLELRYFAPHLLRSFFPGLHRADEIERLIARDVDADKLYAQTRLAGAPEPAAPAETGAEESHEYYWKLIHDAEQAAATGNSVRAAILRTLAARVAPGELTARTKAEAELDLHKLTARLRDALQLSTAEAGEWLKELLALLDKADQGARPVEAALLYDLQKICVDHEREVYALDLVEWLLSAGRRPIKRPLPSQRLVRISRHLRSAAARVVRTRLSGAGRQHLAALLNDALQRNDERLRSRFRLILVDAMQDVGLRPGSAPEQAAFQKIVEELLDRIVGFGFLNFSDLRDTISRNQLKLPDLADPEQAIRGDPLLRLDRRLSTLLDGVYRPSEFYMRWLERFTALNFGTATGRFITRYVTIPFGAGLLLEKGLELVLEKTTGAEMNLISQLIVALCLGFTVLGLMRVVSLRERFVQIGKRVGKVCRRLFIELPRQLLPLAALRRVLASWPVRLCYGYLLKPAIVCALLYLYVPDAFQTVLGGGGIFLAISFALNSRIGMAATELLTSTLLHFYELLRAGLLPVLVRLVLRLFKQVIDTADYVLYSVDEWLRFRSGDGWLSRVVRTILGVVWFPVSYLARFYMVVLIEPMLNPIKLPISILAAKFVYPMLSLWGLFEVSSLSSPLVPLLSPYIGYILAWPLVVGTLYLLPDAFAFLAWELKENWSLYRANRAPDLRSIVVGPHGETVPQLLRPGLHSGTLAKLYARLRRAETSAADGRTAALCRQELHEIERAVRLFATRELLFLLQRDPSWQGVTLAVGRVGLSSNAIEIELTHDAHPDRPVVLTLEENARLLIAGIRAPGWLGALSPEQRRSFATALAGWYKLAGVDLVREQIGAQLVDSAGRYEIAGHRLIVWLGSQPGQMVAYDLRAAEPQAPLEGAPVQESPAPGASALIFARMPVSWQTREQGGGNGQAGEEFARLFLPPMHPNS